MTKKLYISFLLLLCIISFSLKLKAQVFCNYVPPNDLCENAFLVNGSSYEGNTCCGEIENLSLCSNSETGVWFYYIQDLNATLITIENIGILGGIGIEIYSGQCDNLTLLDRSDCSGFTKRKFEVPNCSGRIYIHVTSTENGCGEFLISTSDIEGCEFADHCEDISETLSMQPIADGPQVCVSSCIDYSCQSTCTDASVWFKFHTDDLTTAIQLQINNLDFEPMVSIYRGNNCMDFDDILLCEQIDAGEFTDIGVTPDFTYFVEVSSAGGAPGSFDLCVSALQDFIECSSGELTVTRPENPDGNPNGPYCPGETIVFCYDLQFYVDTPDQGNGCQWLQGIVPILGGGWDLSVNTLQDQNPTGWFWFDDVDYNVDSPVLASGIDPNGNKILEYGPGGLNAGEVLPGGWYFVSNGTNSGCVNDGHPDNMWGVNYPCGQVYTFSHCFELTTKSLTDIEDCEDLFSRDLSITIFNFADGETGCYTSLACSGDTPVRFEGQLDCSNLVDIMASSTEICSGEYADIPVGIVGDYDIPLIVEVIDEGNTSGANDWIFETGSGLIPDRIINDGNDIETITYRVSFFESESVCNTPSVEFAVLVYPDFDISMQDSHVLCEGENKLLSAPAGYDEYAWYNAETNEFLTDSRHYRIDEEGFYRVEITEDLCTKSKIIEIVINDPLSLALDIESLQVCNDYIGTLPSILDLNSIVLNDVIGAWYDDNGFPILDASSISFEGSPTGEFTYEFHTTDASVPCPDTVYTLNIMVEECVCPDLEIISPSDFCAVNQTYYLQNIVINADPGTWTISSGPDPSSISITGDEMYIDKNVPRGTYGLRYTLNDPDVPPLCSGDTTVFFEVHHIPEAMIIPAFAVCNVFTGTLQDSLDLTTLNLSASSGVWSASDSQIIIEENRHISFENVQPGFYNLVFTTDDAEFPCVNSSYETLLTVNECSCPEIDIMPLDNQCIGDLNFDLEELELSSEEGSWSLIDGPDNLNVSVVGKQLNITNNAAEGLYTLRFSLIENPLPPLCQSSQEFSFNLYSEPDASIIENGEACNEDTGTLNDFIDLDDYNLNNSQGFWTSADSGVSINQSDNIVEFTSKEIKTYDFIFTTDSANFPCEEKQYQLSVELLDCSCPSVELGPLGDLCIESQSINLNDIKITGEAGSWTLVQGPASGGIEISGDYLLIGETAEEGLYSVIFELDDKNIGPDCPLTASVDFRTFQAPTADIAEEAIACNAPDSSDPYLIDLDDYNLQNSSGVWISRNTEIEIDSDNIVDFNLQEPGAYSFEFMTNTAQAPCSEAIYTLTVNVKDCLCPALLINAPANFCQEEQVFDLSQLIIESEPGSWEISNTGNNIPEIQGNELYIKDSTRPGSYNLVYTLDDQNVPLGCESSIELNFKIFEFPKAVIIDYAEVCNNYIGSLDTMIDLNDLHMSGDYGAWNSMDPTITIQPQNLVDFSGMPEGEYMFEYTTNTAFMPCVNQTYMVTIRVLDCQCPALEILPLPDMCSDDQQVELADYLNAGMEGEWSVIDGPSMSDIAIANNSILVFDNNISPGSYTLQYRLTGNDLPSLCQDLTQAEFNIIEVPYIELTSGITACNSTDSGFADVIADLDNYVQGSSGMWTSASNEIQIDPSNVVSFEGLEPGNYIFNYTTNIAQEPCEDISDSIIVTVENCVCPLIEFVQNEELCNDQEELQLSSLMLSNPGQGSWRQLAGPQTIDFLEADILDVESANPGEYEFEFEIIENIPQGCESSSSFSFVINEQVQIDVIDFIEVCDRSSSVAPECINLNDMVTGDAGFWTAPVNYTGDFSDITQVCFSGYPEGDSFVFKYETNTAAEGCDELTAELIVSVLDCSCPILDLEGPLNYCNTGNNIDLREYEKVNTVEGNWIFIDGPEQIDIDNSAFSISNIMSGEYTFDYIPDIKPPESCPQKAELKINIEDYRDAGEGLILEYCDNDQLVIPFHELLEQEEIGGEWSITGQDSPAFDMSDKLLDIGTLVPGSYEISYSFDNGIVCPSSSAISQIIIYAVPIADAGEDAALTCQQSEVILGGDMISEGPQFQYVWTELNFGEPLEDQSAHPVVDKAGRYRLELINRETLCSEFDEVVITDNSEQLFFEYLIQNPDCEDPDYAVLSVLNTSGGDGTYQFSVDNGISWTTETVFENLFPGVVTLMMIDGNNCDYEEEVTIEEGVILNVWAGEDMEVEYGDEWIPLQVFTDAADDNIAEIIWEMDGQIICQGSADECFSIEVNPFEYNEFCVTVIDINGCQDSDCMSITELLEVKVYIPNVFSPDSYDKNGRFFVQTNEQVVSVKRFLVMDKWGGTVFEIKEDVLPNESSNGWDGRKLQKEVEEGVYTYHIIVEDVYGEMHSFAGEVTLLR